MTMTTPRRRQIYKPHRVGIDAANRRCNCVYANAPDGDLSYGSSSYGVLPFLAMMRLWFACTVEAITGRGVRYLLAAEAKALQDAADIASGKTRAPALIPEAARAAQAPKIMLSRRAKRILARGLPASRQYGWFRFASPRTLSGNQFFELLAKLSVNGRVGVYRLEYRARLCVRRPENTSLRQSSFLENKEATNLGFCEAHLWPN